MAFRISPILPHGRFLGIDTPAIARGWKLGHSFGEKARDYLNHLIGGRTIQVDGYSPDQYKRILAATWDDPVDVNLLLVAMGSAEVYRGAPYLTEWRR